jgi:hypothetical protein
MFKFLNDFFNQSAYEKYIVSLENYNNSLVKLSNNQRGLNQAYKEQCDMYESHVNKLYSIIDGYKELLDATEAARDEAHKGSEELLEKFSKFGDAIVGHVQREVVVKIEAQDVVIRDMAEQIAQLKADIATLTNQLSTLAFDEPENLTSKFYELAARTDSKLN